MAYQKTECQALGQSLAELYLAVKNGFQAEDAAAAVDFMTKLAAAMDEIQTDMDAAVLDTVSGLTSAVADQLRNQIEPE